MKTVRNNNSKRILVNEVVNIAEDGEITTLDELFFYNDGFKGANRQ